jgi:hypothetical protein
MQAQGMKRFVADHVVESILTAALVGALTGIAVILIAGALLGGSGASVAERGVATVVDTDRAGAGSLGVVHSSGELVGPGEGTVRMYGGASEAAAPAIAPSVTRDEGTRIFGPGEGVNEYTFETQASVIRPDDRINAIAGRPDAAAPATPRTQHTDMLGEGFREFEPFAPQLAQEHYPQPRGLESNY